MRDFVIRFLKSSSGSTAIEYGLIAGLVALVLVVGLTAIGGRLGATYNQVAALFP